MTELRVSVQGTPADLILTCGYELRSSTADGAGSLEQEYVVEPSPALVWRSCEELDQLVTDVVRAGSADSEAGAQLVKIGARLYKALFPSADGSIPELVRRLREAEGPLLLRTNESTIPWELLHDGNDFLAMGRDIGRRPLVTQRVVPGRNLDAIRRALIIGDPLGDLPNAREEAERISAWLHDRGVECTTLIGRRADPSGVQDQLATGEYDLLHYCGHVVTAPGTTYAGLYLHGKEMFDQRSMMSLDAHCIPPVVFVNGCASADRMANLCVPFMVHGAKIVVGARHPVGDVPSREFAEHFYTKLLAKASAGDAVRTARQALRDAGKIEWASFVLYGDPATRIAVGEPAPAPPPQPTSEVDRYRMDAEARLVMDRMVRNAGPAGFVSSLDLFLELLATDVMRARITDAVGAEHLALAVYAAELLRTTQASTPVGRANADRTVQVSDTVNNVLWRAERAAQVAGRDAITVADLIDEFVAVGGGSTGPLLGLLRIPLHRLGPSGPQSVAIRTTESQPAVVPEDPAAADDLFDETGDLRFDRLGPDVVRAIRTAGMVASLVGQPISSGLLLYGFAAAGGGALRGALDRQGDAGAAAIESLTPARRTRENRFSPRLRKILLAALEDRQRLDEAAVLRHLVAEPSSSAREVLTRSSVDIARLVSDL
ncbi:CHAT domain-containing protein [Kutzneria sp. CA-103260]|uniref:CHAT domain-containing protein n=1 Tax=Kutzneria sp. CA-103260 TaxID=2802641 RepID=UPI001BA80057|nr:CHAT domain-containing protein [Kutzneria sp. CA-103260]QUQ67106.1 CHAT domain protein [Kutzneria sp. CA-103260]